MALSSLFTPTIDLPTFIKSLREQIDSDEFSSEMRLLGETLKEKGGSAMYEISSIVNEILNGINSKDTGETIGVKFSDFFHSIADNADGKGIAEKISRGMKNVGSEVTDGFITVAKDFSWKNLIHLGPYVIGIPLATKAAHFALSYLYDLARFNIGRPKLAIETYKASIMPQFLRDITNKITGVFRKEQPQALFNNDLTKKINHIVEGIKNTIKHDGFFQNVLLYGPPGTGKTMVSKEIAKKCGMDYVFMSGGDLGQYIKRGEHVTELNKLITAAESSSNPTIIFIDEAEALCKDRGTLSQELLELQNAFLNRTSTQSKKFLIILATNRKDDLDSAILSRMDHKVLVEAPAMKERVRILQMYTKDMFKKEEVNDFFSLDDCSKIALKTHGLTGRRLFKILNTISTRKHATKDNKLSHELINEVVSDFVNQERQYKGLKLYTRVNNLFLDVYSQLICFFIAIKSSFSGLLANRSIKKA